ncbi:glycosyltransferase [Xenorhabdus japonica]|uniref:glycosyltransferase n=1 Tax=Xenorhabdus japonica TaxID=53341 RepID=UPI003BB7BB92
MDEAFKSLTRNFLVLESIFYRNINGYYHNYTLASDIARLVILYAEGDIYLDSDVKLKKAITQC